MRRRFFPWTTRACFRSVQELRRVDSWETYRAGSDAVSRMFPGCKTYEIQHFAYAVFGRKKLKVNSARFWQSSTLVDGDKEGDDYWSDFRENGWVYHRGPGKDGRRRLHEPVAGDVVLVRTRTSSGPWNRRRLQQRARGGVGARTAPPCTLAQYGGCGSRRNSATAGLLRSGTRIGCVPKCPGVRTDV